MTEGHDRREQIQAQLDVQLRQGDFSGGNYQVEAATFKKGPQRWKTGRIFRIIEPESGRLVATELRFEAWEPVKGTNLISPEPTYKWFCEDEEIELVRQFLNAHCEEGSYALVETEGGLGALLTLLAERSLDPKDFAALLEVIQGQPDLVRGVAESDLGRLLAQSIELERRKWSLDRLRTLIQDSRTTEHQLQAELESQLWIFGGAYVAKALRRQLTTTDIVDIPLVRGDGSLHIIELKRAGISKLVEPHRTGHVVGHEVNRAVGQVQHYLRGLDEERPTILVKHGVDCRRSFATVLIGQADQVADVEKTVVQETLRTYNSHLARIEVMTYDELLDNATRALTIPEVTELPESDDPDVYEDEPDWSGYEPGPEWYGEPPF